MSELVTTSRRAGQCLHPNRVATWPVEGEGFGVDFTYHGATVSPMLKPPNGSSTTTAFPPSSFKELDGACTVRFGPITGEPMRQVLDMFGW